MAYSFKAMIETAKVGLEAGKSKPLLTKNPDGTVSRTCETIPLTRRSILKHHLAFPFADVRDEVRKELRNHRNQRESSAIEVIQRAFLAWGLSIVPHLISNSQTAGHDLELLQERKNKKKARSKGI